MQRKEFLKLKNIEISKNIKGLLIGNIISLKKALELSLKKSSSNQFEINPTKCVSEDFTPTFMVLAGEGGCRLITATLYIHRKQQIGSTVFVIFTVPRE